MTEPISNQYAPPLSAVADMPPDEGYAQLKPFSDEERIGRLRYLAWVVGGGIVINIVSGVLVAMLAAISEGLGSVVGIGTGLVALWFAVVTGIKRAHDFDANGWWSIVTLVPLVGIVVWSVIPGTRGSNRYGPPPPPNTWGVRVLAVLMPVAFIGILAAVAIPQYKTYVDKARAAPSSNLR